MRSTHAIVKSGREVVRDLGPSGCREHPDRALEMLACANRVTGFLHFLRHWKFVNRETGEVQTLDPDHLWEGQRDIVEQMSLHTQLIILKAGKLGASELECAFDGWRARFGGPNMRVHIFSRDAPSAHSMLRIVKFGLSKLPDYMRLEVAAIPEANTLRQIVYDGPGPDDRRTIVSYASTKHAAIDQSAHHSHVDELARMAFPQDTWASVESTVAPGGTMHIVSRGAGAQNYMTDIWEQAGQPASVIKRVFEPWWSRPRAPEGPLLKGRVERGEIEPGAAWYAEQEAAMPTTSQLWYYAPETPEQALAGAAEDAFVDISRWDACYDPDLPPLLPGDPDPCVLSLDAGITNDVFAATLTTRHPQKHGTAALRGIRAWVPEQNGTEINLGEVEEWIRLICLGGCVLGHPNRNRRGDLSAGLVCSEHLNLPHGHGQCSVPGLSCPQCAAGNRLPPLNIVCIVYDRYELRDMMQRIAREEVAWCKPMDQGSERTDADTNLHTLLVQRDIAHRIDPADQHNLMRVHVQGAKGKVPAGDDDRVRIEKRAPGAKIDLLVSLSMGVKICLWLSLAPTPRAA